MESQFRMASSNFRANLTAFRAVPKESLTKLGTRFDEVSDPLIEHNQMISRRLALHFAIHLPAHIRKAVVSKMRKTDEKRFEKKLPYLTKNEVLLIARRKEASLVESEAEAMVAGILVYPRDTDDFNFPPPPPRPEYKPMEEHLTRDVREWLGPRVEWGTDTQLCNNCNKVGHIARYCPEPARTAAVAPPQVAAQPAVTRSASMAAHKTDGATCTSCKRTGHVEAQ